MASQSQQNYTKPKALLFDIFGTVYEWRRPVIYALATACNDQLDQDAHLLASKDSTSDDNDKSEEQKDVQSLAKSTTSRHLKEQRANALRKAKQLVDQHSEKDKDWQNIKGAGFWSGFAQEWRASYFAFTRTYTPPEAGKKGETATSRDKELEWVSVDTHHYNSLVTLLDSHGLTSLFPGQVLRTLTMVWHHLPAHPDCASGISQLTTNLGIKCYSLGNGNDAILYDLSKSSSSASHQPVTSSQAETGTKTIDMTAWYSAETFQAYKPSPSTYLGACTKLNLKPEEVGMVAAHMNDCLAARSFGLQAFYIERMDNEEAWTIEECHDIADSGKGLIQEAVWFKRESEQGHTEDGGIVELAKRLENV